MLTRDERVPGIEYRPFELPAEEQLGMMDDVLVEGVRHRDEHDRAVASPPSDPSDPLPGRDQGTGVSDKDAEIEAPDVDAQLERAGREHREQFTAEEPSLDPTALLGEVSGAVGGDAILPSGFLTQQPGVQ
jgi:hypothetical protein